VDASLARSLDRLRARAALAAFAGTALTWLALAAAALGALALLLRAALGLEQRAAALVLLPLLLVPPVAWAFARRRVPSRAATAAWLDVRGGGSGAVVAAFEVEDPRWQAQLAAALGRGAELPRVRLARPAGRALLAGAFASGALLVPLPRAAIGPPPVVQEAALERVEEQLAALQEQVQLDAELAEELREALSRLQQEGALREPESAFEALDRASERLEQEALENAETAQAAREDLARAAEAAAADPEAAQAELERTLGELSKAGFGKDVQAALKTQLGVAAAALPPGTKLDAAALKALSSQISAKLGERLGALAKAGLLDAKSLQKLSELARLDEFRSSDHVCDERCKQQPGGT
jgi:hypothetical protein